MTIPAFRQNLFAGIAAAATPLPSQVSTPAPKAMVPPVSRQVAAPVKSQSTILVERQAAERVRVAAAAEQQRKAELAAAEEKVRRRAAADAVWTKAWASRNGQPGMNAQADDATSSESASVWEKARATNASTPQNGGGAAQDQIGVDAKRKASDDVWARARAKNEALYAHLDNGKAR